MLGNVFDPAAEFLIYETCRPHWSQTGTMVFLTFRLADSVPKSVVQRWDREKCEWLRQRGVSVDTFWTQAVDGLDAKDRIEFNRRFDRTREAYLDTCHGSCVLRKPELAKIVSDSLLHFDAERYRMGDFIVMPNHVHCLVAFGSEQALKEQCDSWLHFTAVKINQALGQKGKLWQQEPFDHLVRSPEQYDYLRGYIRDNPLKARLKEGEYLYRRYEG